jgi:hypothetical protein
MSSTEKKIIYSLLKCCKLSVFRGDDSSILIVSINVVLKYSRSAG